MIDDIHARVPISRVAAMVVGNGVHFNPNKKGSGRDSELPIETRKINKAEIGSTEFTDLTGMKSGRFTVIGLAANYKGWVVRCSCGRYSTRRSKSIKNTTKQEDRCDHCQHLAFLQKRNAWLRKEGGNQTVI